MSLDFLKQYQYNPLTKEKEVFYDICDGSDDIKSEYDIRGWASCVASGWKITLSKKNGKLPVLTMAEMRQILEFFENRGYEE